MSHTVKIKTKFMAFDSLKKAFEKLGWTIKENAKMRVYPGDPTANKVWKFVAVNPKQGGYDLGLDVDPTTGEISCNGDFYGGSISASLGNELNTLKQEYGMQVIEDEYTWEGYSVTRVKNQDGTWEVSVEK